MTKDILFNQQWAERVFGGELPFSFVYGGRHSAEFIGSWRREGERWTDPVTGLEVRVEFRVYDDTPGVDWTIHFTNTGMQDTPIIEKVKAVDAGDVVGKDVVLRRLNGSPCLVDDWMPFDQPVAAGQRIEFAATHGRSANVSPWFTVDWGTGGVITAIGWSGQWCAAVEHKDGRVRVEAGMQFLHTVLRPGESIRSPRILQLRWQGGDQYRAYSLFRRTMLAHIMPRLNGEVVVPPIAHLSTSFYELNDSNEQNVLSHLESTKGLGFEVFWLDAFWTGPLGFPSSMGNYGFPIERVEPRDRFPNGLRAIGAAVEKAGQKFLMWFEPERVVGGTFLAKEHPNWIFSLGNDGGGLFNLGHPEARQFMTDYLNAVIKEYKMTCLRIDYNIDPLRFWQSANAKDKQRVGLAEIRYVEGLYRMWDDILAANPKLYIDNCASGGRRIDLEAMSRAVALWRSDNTCDMTDLKAATIALAAMKNQCMSGGLNRYVPFSVVGQMGATPYLFRSGFNAGIAFCEDIRAADYPRELLRQAIAEGKRLRKYFFGDFYPLSRINVDPQDWCVLQYHRAEQGDGMVIAFCRPESPYTAWRCRLRDIEPAARYRVTVLRSYEPDPPVTLTGAELEQFKIEIEDRPGSVIVEYQKEGI
ncbi:MAG: Alpha-galactosidase Mel36A [Verrucomicrobiae bacterium]|nr:Alpha-galactosidase Mel36A [Verrucomicrobiae bacterium]